MIDPTVFRAYDIRGLASLGDLNVGDPKIKNNITASISTDFSQQNPSLAPQIDPHFAEILGRCFGRNVLAVGERWCIVGRDCRLSSKLLFDSIVIGLNSVGVGVIDVGMVPSPLCYYATKTSELTTSAIMITASHNPPNDNGFKLILADKTLFGEQISALRDSMLIESENDLQSPSLTKPKLEKRDVFSSYISDITASLGHRNSDVQIGKIAPARSVIVDCGNSVVGLYAPKLLRALGYEVYELFCTPDGTFPNHHPDPSKRKNLQSLIKEVKRRKAHIGLAYDGDGDRLGVVDENGEHIIIDSLIMLYVSDVLRSGEGGKIVYDVKCSSSLHEYVKALSGTPLMTRTGHSFIKKRLQDEGALFAGEASGHLFFPDEWHNFDDALYASVRLLTILNNRAPSEMFAQMSPGYTSEEMSIKVPEEKKFDTIDTALILAETSFDKVISIDGLRIEQNEAWLILRASNTSAALVCRYGGRTVAQAQALVSEIQAKIIDKLLPDVALADLT